METYGDTVMMYDNKQGVDRVKKERESYAFFMESSTIEYEVQRNCDLTEVGAWLDNKAYGIAMPFSECTFSCYTSIWHTEHDLDTEFFIFSNLNYLLIIIRNI